MRLGSKMNDGIDVVLFQQTLDENAIADAALDKRVSGWIRQLFQIFPAAGIGQCVQIDNLSQRFAGQDEMDEIGADEPRSTGYQDVLHRYLLEKVSIFQRRPAHIFCRKD